MATEIVVPRLGWSMDEGTFVEWLKADGEMVNAGDMLFVLEGEKAAQEVESFDSGILHIPAKAPQSGDTVLVSQVLGFLLEQGEAPPEFTPAISQLSADTEQPKETPVNLQEKKSSTESAVKHRQIASPRARRKARELRISLDGIQGTGRHGRIRERDVIAAGNQQISNTRVAADITFVKPTEPGMLQPLTNVRRITAARMQASTQQTVPVTLNTKFNAKGLIEYRESLKGGASTPSYNDIIMKLVGDLLRECVELNACWTADGVYVYEKVNIAFAVDTPNGLLAPVINQVDKLMLDDVAEYSRELIEDARAGRLGEEQLTGGTFTISSLGTLGIDHFTPVINLPQAGILGIGRIIEEPVLENGEVVPGSTMSLSLTFDHQVLDGAPAAGWLQKLANALTCPEQHIK